ncbi:MAG: hypothetical protein ACQR33_04050 [Candidatus Saccharibacteria bacterium]
MMFGHSDDDQHHEEHNGPMPDGNLSSDSTAMPTATPALPNDDDAASDFIMTDAPAPTEPMQHHDDMPVVIHDTSHDEPSLAPHPKSHVSDELLRIKQEAIQELAPMVDHLDQTPDEKFRTTMMMIQATDNDQLIPAAYAAAKAIPDEKTRAQAYLDIVNEINYFTQADFDKAA